MVIPLLSTHVKEIGFSSTVVGVIGTVNYRKSTRRSEYQNQNNVFE